MRIWDDVWRIMDPNNIYSSGRFITLWYFLVGAAIYSAIWSRLVNNPIKECVQG
jgi:hypothetical protein